MPDPAAPESTGDDRRDAIRAEMRELMTRAHVPGMSLAVVSRSGLVHTDALGFADLGRGTPATADTAYLWFSMTKPVTATAALKLADEGRLDLDAPVSEYVDLVRAPGDRQPTVQHLLTHSSGLGNPLPLKWIHRAGEPGPDQGEMLRRILGMRRPFRYPVGKAGRYSNVGYLVVAEIIRRVTGEPFDSYVRRSVLDPLGMAATGFAYAPGRPAATGYVRVPRTATPLLSAVLPEGIAGPRQGSQTALNPFLVDGAGYGGLVGPVTDAAAFVQLHLNDGMHGRHRILREATAQTMRRLTVQGNRFRHGQGWFRKPATGSGANYVEHFGTGIGFWNVMRLYPGRNLGAVIMTNGTSGYNYNALFKRILVTPWA